MWYDLIVFLILALAVYRGAVKGVVWQFAAIGGILLCFSFAEPLSLLLTPYISLTPPFDRWVAMLILYLMFSFVSFFGAFKLKSWIEKKRFEEYDRHLGALFGFAKGALFCFVMTFFVATLSANEIRASVLSSFSGRVAARVMNGLVPVLPDGVAEMISPYLAPLQSRSGEGSSEPGEASQIPPIGVTPPNLPIEIPIELGPESIKGLLSDPSEPEEDKPRRADRVAVPPL
ncbi:MAG: hypothetical protein CMJ78_01270 [Planctomycetaceae bacterium]|nr:hypothetical protein [Planctomycetaceae bacterium]